MNEGSFRIEDEDDVRAYLQNLKYCIRSGSTINLIRERRVDQDRDIKYTNRFTIHDLFPNEDPVTALKRELQTLSVRDYIHTLKDTRYPQKKRMASVWEDIWSSRRSLYQNPCGIDCRVRK